MHLHAKAINFIYLALSDAFIWLLYITKRHLIFQINLPLVKHKCYVFSFEQKCVCQKGIERYKVSVRKLFLYLTATF